MLNDDSHVLHGRYERELKSCVVCFYFERVGTELIFLMSCETHCEHITDPGSSKIAPDHNVFHSMFTFDVTH